MRALHKDVQAILPELRRSGWQTFWASVIVGLVTAAVFGTLGVRWGIEANEDAHIQYVDAHRPCLFAEEQVFDLPYIAYINLSGPDEGTVTFSRVGTPLFLHAIHFKNNGTGYLHDVRASLVLPGPAYVTTSDRRDTTIDASPVTVTIALGGNDFSPTNVTRDPRLTHARGFETHSGKELPSRNYIMPSGNETPANWSAIFHWSPNVANASGSSIVHYFLPALGPEEEWWVGTWYYQHDANSNEYDTGTTLTGWSQGYDGPLYASHELRGLFAEPQSGVLEPFCSWMPRERR